MHSHVVGLRGGVGAAKTEAGFVVGGILSFSLLGY